MTSTKAALVEWQRWKSEQVRSEQEETDGDSQYKYLFQGFCCTGKEMTQVVAGAGNGVKSSVVILF